MRRVTIYMAMALMFLAVGPLQPDQNILAQRTEGQPNQAMPWIPLLLLQGEVLTVTTQGQGSVTFDPPGGTYDQDTLVTLTAFPDSGWRFDSWSGAASGTNNPVTITMDGDQSVTATFIQIHSLGLATQGQGNVTADPADGPYDHGTVVTLTASAASGYRFGSWSGDANGTNEQVIVTMDSDKSVTATFIQQHTLTVTTAPPGSGSVTRNPDAATYDHDSSVLLKASAAPGWRFSHWSGHLFGSTNPISVFMNTDKSVTANFVEVHALSVTTEPDGSGSVALDPPVQPDIDWEGEFFQFSYQVGSNGGTFFNQTVFDWQEINNFAGCDETSCSYSGTVETTTSPTWGFIEMKAGALGPEASTSPPDGLLVKGYAEMNLNGFNPLNHGVLLTGPVDGIDLLSAVFRRFSVHTPGEYALSAVLRGVIDFNVFGSRSASYFSSFGVSGEVELEKFVVNSVGTATSLGLVTRLSLNMIDSAQAQVILYPQIGGEDIVYQLKVVLHLTAELQNLIFPSTITSGSAPFVGPFKLGSVANPLELETFLSFVGRAYDDGTTVTLTAVANSGWQFTEWTGDLSGSENPKTLTMGSDKSVTANFVAILPDIGITKTANPTSVPEPGGDVEFTIVVTNNSSEAATLDLLVDDVFGDLNGKGDCTVGQTLAGSGGAYTCAFTEFVSGEAGQTHTNVTTATASDDRGNEVSASDDATVSFTDVLPNIDITKTANPTTLPEPGGDVEFTIVVSNNSESSDPVTLNSLVDDIYGNLNGQGDCSVPQTIAAGGSYTCSFAVAVSGNGGESQTDTATGSGVDDEDNPVSASDDATVTITDALPDIGITKTANPTTLPEPGGDVEFTIVVSNNSASSDPVTLNSLVDDVYGNLNGQGDCSVPQTIAPGGSYTCSFTGAVSGNSGESQTDTATGSGTDDESNPVDASDDATVTIGDVQPTIAMEKTAEPTSVSEPGGDVTFTVVVTNNSVSSDPVTLISLVDDVYGNLNARGDCSVPQTIVAGESYTCSFTGAVSGNADESQTDTATAAGVDDEANPVDASDDATVTITGVDPVIAVDKTADPTTVSEPGGDVTFTVVVTNNSVSSDPVSLVSLVDDIYGSLNGEGTCSVPQTIAAGGSFTCSFTGAVSGNSGESQTDTVTAAGTDDEGSPVNGSDDATVTITGMEPVIAVDKTADPTTVSEPGGEVTFTVVVTNNSASSDPVTLSSLVDDIYGNLNGQGSCSAPQTIAAGGSYSCSFTAAVSGNVGDTQTDTATASATDDEGNKVNGSDDATVTIGDVQPTIAVDKTAVPTSVSEPGGDIEFTIVVSNNSVSSDPVSLSALVDAPYGNLNGQGDCSLPQTVAAGGSYTCTFTASVSGNAGDTRTDTVTASGTDDEANPVSGSDDAAVTITGLDPLIAVEKTADPTTVPEPGGDVEFTIVVSNNSVSSDPLTLVSLADAPYGNLNGQGDCSLPQTVAAGGSYSCSFTAAVSGNVGDTRTDTVTAAGTDDEGNPVSGSDDATVTVIDVASAIEIVKTADPITVEEPGGDVTFTFTVNNLSSVDSVTIDNLSDTIHGDLNGQGDCSVPQTIPAGGSYSCSFTTAVNGNAGDTETNVATASGLDDDGNAVSDFDDATVTVTDVAPAITVDKTAVDTLSAPGGPVTYTVTVTNTSVSSDPVTLTSLTDSIYGDLTDPANDAISSSTCVLATVAVGTDYSCTFDAEFTGSSDDFVTDTVAVNGQDDEGTPVPEATDNHTVTLIP